MLYQICNGTCSGAINEEIKYPGAIGKGIILRIRIKRDGDVELTNIVKKDSIEYIDNYYLYKDNGIKIQNSPLSNKDFVRSLALAAAA